MSFIEVSAVLDALNENYQDTWEQTRFSAFIQALSNGSKLKNSTEILKFPWDTEVVKEIVSAEDLEKRKQQLFGFISGSENLKEFNPLIQS